jgi:hypothetical protein
MKLISAKIYWVLFSAILIFGLISTILPHPTKAVSASDWSPGKIIDDAVFFNKDAISPAQIQAFLNSKVPVCDTNHQAAFWMNGVYNAPPYTCLKDYSSGGKSAAQIIWEAGQAHGINPEVLVVMLQKETGLVTDTWAAPWQYDRAMGYGCPDTADCNTAYYGFANQVHNAAWQLKAYVTNPNGYNFKSGVTRNIQWSPNGACGSSPVFIENSATAALYNYTPYQPNQAALNNLYGTGDGCSAYGNRNFWRMFNDWFGSTAISNLVRTPSSPTYYLLTNNQRFAIPNGDLLYAYGLEGQQLSVISDAALEAIPSGGMLQTSFMVPGNGTVFLADLSNKFGIASGEYCVNWGINCSSPSQIGAEIASGLKDGGVLQPIMFNSGGYYLMEGGIKKQFLSVKAMTDRGYSPSSSSKISNWTNAIRSFGFSFPEDGSFVKFASGNAIFAYTQGNFYNIASYDQFSNWSSSSTPSHYDSTSKYNSQPPSISGSLSDIVTTNGNKYLVDGGRRINLTSLTNDWPTGSPAEPFNIFLNRLPINASITPQTSFRQPDGGIYKVLALTKQPFNSLSDYFDLGYGSKPSIQLSSPINLAVGNTVFAEGSAYKITGSDAIYRIGLNNTARPFSNLKQVWDFKTNPIIPTINSNNASHFTSSSATLKSMIKNAQGQIFIVNAQGKIPMSSSNISIWGMNVGGAIEVGNASLDRIASLPITPQFLSGPNGTIYKGENGTKKPIASFESYKILGGNSTNTTTAAQDVLDQMPTGSIIQ